MFEIVPVHPLGARLDGLADCVDVPTYVCGTTVPAVNNRSPGCTSSPAGRIATPLDTSAHGAAIDADKRAAEAMGISGTPAFVFADGDHEVRLEAKPGDYIFVPPYVPHREENPGGDEAVVVIARSSQEGIVVNLESLWPSSPPGPPA